MILYVRNNLAQHLGMNEKNQWKRQSFTGKGLQKRILDILQIHWTGMQVTFAENDGNDCSVGLPANQLTIRTYNVLQMLIAVSGEL